MKGGGRPLTPASFHPYQCGKTFWTRSSLFRRLDPDVAVLDFVDEGLRVELLKALWQGEQTGRLRFDSNVFERDRRTVGCLQLYRKPEVGIDPAPARLL